LNEIFIFSHNFASYSVDKMYTCYFQIFSVSDMYQHDVFDH